MFLTRSFVQYCPLLQGMNKRVAAELREAPVSKSGKNLRKKSLEGEINEMK